MKVTRQIIRVDESACSGCGKCVLSCAEGALQVVDGKARLVGEVLCDGMGACIPECPQGAITIEEREAEKFDPEVATDRLGALGAPQHHPARPQAGLADTSASSQLGNWPVQLRLVSPTASFLRRAKLVIAADCVPFAFADFHRRFAAGRVVLVGCPKLDDADFYREKLAQLFAHNDVASVEVVHMEVPCCHGLVRIVEDALRQSGKQLPVTLARIGIRGQIVDSIPPAPAGIQPDHRNCSSSDEEHLEE